VAMGVRMVRFMWDANPWGAVKLCVLVTPSIWGVRLLLCADAILRALGHGQLRLWSPLMMIFL